MAEWEAKQMMDLTDFLLARISEDEAAARAVVAGPWVYATDEKSVLDFAARRATAPGSEEATNLHVHRWGPGRVLAECEAKRRIVTETSSIDATLDPESSDALTFALRCLALPYADHRDYREEWRP